MNESKQTARSYLIDVAKLIDCKLIVSSEGFAPIHCTPSNLYIMEPEYEELDDPPMDPPPDDILMVFEELILPLDP